MPKLIVQEADGASRTLDLGAEPTLIGRSAECQVQTQDALVSRRHARIVWDGGYWIEDLGSSNGVFVGGERVQRAPLRPGDEVRCGTLLLRLMPDTRPRPQSIQPQPPPPASSPAAGGPPNTTMQPATVSAPVILHATGAALLHAPPGAGAPDGTVEAERARRIAAEGALLRAEQRAATAEGRLQDAEARAAAAEAQAAGVAQVEQAARQAEGYRRQVEQLRAELRRLRGGGEEATDAGGGASSAMMAEVVAERDQLRDRLGEMEAKLAPSQGGGDEGALLKRRVDQLTAELRRVRGGLPAPEPVIDDGRVAELEAKLERAERERDEARQTARAVAASAVPAAAPTNDAASEEVARLRRMVDQLGAENRRLRQGASPGPALDDPRVADLEARLGRAEKERDALRSAPKPSPAPPRPDAASVEAIGQIDDALADLRASLRAANDEVGVLGVEAPGDSVQVLKDALSSAGEQTEAARARLRELRKALGVT
jgi:uncharacterized coiled-coil DUF342 family protein